MGDVVLAAVMKQKRAESVSRGNPWVTQEQCDSEWSDKLLAELGRRVSPVVNIAPSGTPASEQTGPVKVEPEPPKRSPETERLLVQDRGLAHRERQLLAELGRVRVRRAHISISLLRQQGGLGT